LVTRAIRDSIDPLIIVVYCSGMNLSTLQTSFLENRCWSSLPSFSAADGNVEQIAECLYGHAFSRLLDLS